jgi:hypothetical protein
VTKRYPAVHAARALDTELVFIQWYDEFAKVLYAIGSWCVGPVMAFVFQEAGWFTPG